MQETLDRLQWIAHYATFAREQMEAGKTLPSGSIKRMAELAEIVEKSLDTHYEEWVDAINAHAETRRELAEGEGTCGRRQSPGG